MIRAALTSCVGAGLALSGGAASAGDLQMASAIPHNLQGSWSCSSFSDADGDAISGVWTAHYGDDDHFMVDFEGSWERANRPGELVRWAVKSEGNYQFNGETLTEQNTSFVATELPPIGFDEVSRVQGETMTRRLVTYLNSDFGDADVSDVQFMNGKTLQYGEGNSCVRIAEATS